MVDQCVTLVTCCAASLCLVLVCSCMFQTRISRVSDVYQTCARHAHDWVFIAHLQHASHIFTHSCFSVPCISKHTSCTFLLHLYHMISRSDRTSVDPAC